MLKKFIFFIFLGFSTVSANADTLYNCSFVQGWYEDLESGERIQQSNRFLKIDILKNYNYIQINGKVKEFDKVVEFGGKANKVWSDQGNELYQDENSIILLTVVNDKQLQLIVITGKKLRSTIFSSCKKS